MDKKNFEIFERIKSNSIGNDKKEKLVKKTKEVSKKIFAILLALTISSFMCACGLTEKKVNDDFVDMYYYETINQIENYFEQKNLYCNLVILSDEELQSILYMFNEEDMFIYYDKLGYSSCEKLCRAFGYENFDDYLIKNNYVDENGNPSIKLLREATEIRATKEMSGRMK